MGIKIENIRGIPGFGLRALMPSLVVTVNILLLLVEELA